MKYPDGDDISFYWEHFIFNASISDAKHLTLSRSNSLKLLINTYFWGLFAVCYFVFIFTYKLHRSSQGLKVPLYIWEICIYFILTLSTFDMHVIYPAYTASGLCLIHFKLVLYMVTVYFIKH